MLRLWTKTKQHAIETTILLVVVSVFVFGAKLTRPNSAYAAAGINQQLNYQGKLMSTAGVQVSDGSWNFRFRAYGAASGGAPVWTERWTSTTTRVSTVNGIFSVALGTIGGFATSSINWNSDNLYLQVDIDADNNGSWEEAFSTRKRITSSAYAFNADMVDGLHATSTAAVANYLTALDANKVLNLYDGGVSSTRATTTQFVYIAPSAEAGSVTNLDRANGDLYVADDIEFDSELFGNTARLSVLNATTTNVGTLTVYTGSTFNGLTTFSDLRATTLNATSTTLGTVTGYGLFNLTDARVATLNATSTTLGTLTVYSGTTLNNLTTASDLRATTLNATSTTLGTVTGYGLFNLTDLRAATLNSTSTTLGTVTGYGLFNLADLRLANGLNASTTANFFDLLAYNNATTTNHFAANSTLYVRDNQVMIGSGTATTTSGYQLKLFDNSGLADAAMLFDVGSDSWHVGVHDTDSQKFKIGFGSNLSSNNYLTIATGGAFGVNTTTPGEYYGEKFTVNGNSLFFGSATTTGGFIALDFASTTNLILADQGLNRSGANDLYVSSGTLFFDTIPITGGSGFAGVPGSWQSTFGGLALTPTSTSAGIYVTASSTITTLRVESLNATSTTLGTVTGYGLFNLTDLRAATLNSTSTTLGNLTGYGLGTFADFRPAILNASSTTVGTLTAYSGGTLNGLFTTTDFRPSMLNASTTNVGTLTVYTGSTFNGLTTFSDLRATTLNATSTTLGTVTVYSGSTLNNLTTASDLRATTLNATSTTLGTVTGYGLFNLADLRLANGLNASSTSNFFNILAYNAATTTDSLSVGGYASTSKYLVVGNNKNLLQPNTGDIFASGGLYALGNATTSGWFNVGTAQVGTTLGSLIGAGDLYVGSDATITNSLSVGSLTANQVVVGGGTAGPVKVITAGTDGQLLIGQTSAAPAFTTISGQASVTAGGVWTNSDVTCTDCLGVTEIADSYLLNTGDSGTGLYTFDDLRPSVLNASTTNVGTLTVYSGTTLNNLTTASDLRATTLNATSTTLGTVTGYGLFNLADLRTANGLNASSTSNFFNILAYNAATTTDSLSVGGYASTTSLYVGINGQTATTTTLYGGMLVDSTTLVVNANENRVGIGTTVPDSSLTIGTDASGNGIYNTATKVEIQGSALSATDQVMLRLARGESGGLFYPGGADFKLASYGSGGVGDNYAPKSKLTIALKAGSNYNEGADTDVMTLLSSGNVGIGTTTPQSLINTTASKVLAVSAQSGFPALVINNTVQDFNIAVTNGAFIDIAGNATAANNFIAFRTSNTASSYSVSEAMRITSAGNVQVATSTTATNITFAVDGQASSYPIGAYTRAQYGGIFLASNNLKNMFEVYPDDADLGGTILLLSDLGTNKIVLDVDGNTYFNGGNVGIGDTTPLSLFTVGSGDKFRIDASGNATSSGWFNVGTADVGALGALVGAGDLYVGADATTTGSLSVDGTTLLVDSSSNKVIIKDGSSSGWTPDSTFNLYNAQGTSLMNIAYRNSTGGTPRPIGTSLGQINFWSAYSGDATVNRGRIELMSETEAWSPQVGIQFYASNGSTNLEVLRLTGTQKVGIGDISNPTSTLSVAGSADIRGNATTTGWFNIGTTAIGTTLGSLIGAGDLYVGRNATVTKTLQVGLAGTDGEIRMYSEQGATDYQINIIPAAAMTQNVTYTLPVDDGTSGQYLSTDGAGVMSWGSPTGSGTVNSGESGRLAFYPSTGTAVDDVIDLYWDSTNLVLSVATSTRVIGLANVAGQIISPMINSSGPNLLSYSATTTYLSSGYGLFSTGGLANGQDAAPTYISSGGNAGTAFSPNSGGDGANVYLANGGLPNAGDSGNGGAAGNITMAAGGGINGGSGSYGKDGIIMIGNSAGSKTASLFLYGTTTMSSDRASGYTGYFFNDGNNANRYGLKVQAGADDGSGTTYYLDAYDGDGGQVGYLANVSGTFGVTDPSDIRTKTNVVDTQIDALAIIQGLHIVDYNRLSDPDGPILHGFIAQEAREVFPEMVVEGANGYLGVMKDTLIPVLVKAVQDQGTILDALRGEIDTLHIEIAEEEATTTPPLEVVENPDVAYNTLVVRDAAEFNGTLLVRGAATFEGVLTVKDDLYLDGRLYVSTNQAGTAIVAANATSTEVIFDEAYDTVPKVVVNFVDDDETTFVTYKVARKTANGFRIILSQPATRALTFDWLALPVRGENQPPTITELITSVGQIAAGNPVELWAKVTDPDTNDADLQYSWQFSPAIGAVDGNSGLVNWTVDAAQAPAQDTDVTITVSVADGKNIRTATTVVRVLAGVVAGASNDEAADANNNETADAAPANNTPVEAAPTDNEPIAANANNAADESTPAENESAPTADTAPTDTADGAPVADENVDAPSESPTTELPETASADPAPTSATDPTAATIE